MRKAFKHNSLPIWGAFFLNIILNIPSASWAQPSLSPEDNWITTSSGHMEVRSDVKSSTEFRATFDSPVQGDLSEDDGFPVIELSEKQIPRQRPVPLRNVIQSQSQPTASSQHTPMQIRQHEQLRPQAKCQSPSQPTNLTSTSRQIRHQPFFMNSNSEGPVLAGHMDILTDVLSNGSARTTYVYHLEEWSSRYQWEMHMPPRCTTDQFEESMESSQVTIANQLGIAKFNDGSRPQFSESLTGILHLLDNENANFNCARALRDHIISQLSP